MATTNDFSISNISYTNKDFQTIYPELLDKAKSLSYKWDPTVSNESDPGVVLLKLDALVADKNNYNIDKNVLEYFPVSVTQEAVARGLFEQLGYSMHWYTAATTTVNVDWSGSVSGKGYPQLPLYTMVCDEDSSVVYTIVGSATRPASSTVAVYPVMQGKHEIYTVNGETTILGDALDSDNRIYINNYSVAQNGIFIKSLEQSGQTWKRVDNLSTQDYGTPCYKFGVSDDGKSCYIEFPTDADELIGSGIEVHYLITDGLAGNISVKTLSRLYEDKVDVDYEDSEGNKKTETVSSSDLSINNYRASVNGKNPESIDSAYRNYKKTIGTFNTLVSLTDYENKINTSEYASNSFVCDRTNDVQDSYKVITNKSGVYSRDTIIETDTDGKPLMDAFALKIYALQYAEAVTTANFGSTFDIIKNFKTDDASSSTDIELLESYLESNKSIQHNFQELEENKILFLKNKYPIVAKIIPQYQLTSMQVNEVLANVYSALCENFNAKEISFGEEISYDKVYDTILGADERIKAVALDDIEYTTYAVVYYRVGENAPVLKEFQVSHKEGDGYSADPTASGFQLEIQAKSILNGNTPLYIRSDDIEYAYNQNSKGLYKDVVSVTPKTTIIGEGTGNTRTFKINDGKSNESILLYAPSYREVKRFSSYMTYIYNGNAISSDGMHELGSSEYLTLFYRDSDESPFSYIKYVGSVDKVIISPNFNMTNNESGAPESLKSLLSTGGNVAVASSQYTDDIASLSSTKYSLGATKTISTKEKVSYSYDSSDDKVFYWILNSKTSIDNVAYYTLFEGETDAKANATQSRVLRDGEYLFVTSGAKQEYAVYGSGTRVTRTFSKAGKYDAWRCEAQDVSDVTTEGASAIFDWKSIPNDTSLLIEEMQLFVATGKVVFDDIKDSANKTFEFRSDGLYIDSTQQAFPSGITITADGTQLPNISVGTDSWYGNSCLAFVASPSSPQKLLTSDQEIEIATSSISNGVVVTTSETVTGTDAGVYIQPDYTYNMQGWGTLDVTRTLVNGTVEKATLYAYSESATQSDVSYDTYGVAKLSFDGSNTSISIALKLPEDSTNGNSYLIRLEAPTSLEKGTFTVSTSENTLALVSDGKLSEDSKTIDFTGTKAVYFMYLVKNTEQDTITVTQVDKVQKTVSMYNPFPTNTKVDSGLLKKVQELDVNGSFDYTYEVPDDDLIEDPLLAKSFIDVNHVYNPFTICQADFSVTKPDISVMNKVR